MRARGGQSDCEVLAGFGVGLLRNRDAARGRDRLEPHRDVDVVAEQLVLVGQHVAHMDAHAEMHGSICGKVVVALRHERLHRDGGLDRADDARKFQQETVAGVLHQAPAMIKDDRIDRASVGLE